MLQEEKKLTVKFNCLTQTCMAQAEGSCKLNKQTKPQLPAMGVEPEKLGECTH